MTPAEFEEASYEAPLYNQLERGVRDVYTPGRVLENRLGFDRGILVADHAVWQTLGYSAPPTGVALGYYHWLFGSGPPLGALPRFRLNLFIQAKRPICYPRRPRKLAGIAGYSGPLWAFSVSDGQQRLLQRLADRASRRAHVTYAAPAFHTRADLYAHTQRRSVVQNSTFPSALALRGHGKWYYKEPGATGIANPDPQLIEERPFLERIASQATDAHRAQGDEDLANFERTAQDVIAAIHDAAQHPDPTVAKYMNDLQTLERALEPFGLPVEVKSYAQVKLFEIVFDLTWLIYGPAQ